MEGRSPNSSRKPILRRDIPVQDDVPLGARRPLTDEASKDRDEGRRGPVVPLRCRLRSTRSPVGRGVFSFKPMCLILGSLRYEKEEFIFKKTRQRSLTRGTPVRPAPV